MSLCHLSPSGQPCKEVNLPFSCIRKLMLKELSDWPKGAELTKWQCGLLAGMQIGAASVENIRELPRKIKNGPWWEWCRIDWKVTDSSPSQGTYSGSIFDPWSGHITKSDQSMFFSHINVYLSLSVSLPRSLLLFLKAVKKKIKQCPWVRIKK